MCMLRVHATGMNVCIHMYVYMYVCMCVYTYVCIHLCIYVCMYVCEQSVGVSSLLGLGVTEFFNLVDNAREEFIG